MKINKYHLIHYVKIIGVISLLLFIHFQYQNRKPLPTYSNGQKKSIGAYKNGMPEGTWTWWYENGEKMTEGIFVDGKRNGIWNTWHFRGQIKSKGTYIDDKLNGTFVSWYQNGNLKYSGNYVDDKLHGIQQYYDLSGDFIEENEFRNGLEVINSNQ